MLTVNPGALPEGVCYQTEQERLEAYAANLEVVLPENYSTVNVGSNTPGVDDRDKPWLRTNVDGSPDGVYHFFDGTWKRKHGLDPGHIHMWLGTDGAVDTLDGGTSGVATTISGPFWEIVTAFEAKFPVGAGTFAASGAVAVAGTGGEDKHTLLEAELPAHKHQCFKPGSTGDSNDLDSTHATYERLAVSSDPSYNLARTTLDGEPSVGPTNNVGSGTPMNNLPPYLGVRFIRRTVRIYYSI